MSKLKFSTNSPSEKRVGYSRAIVVDEKRMYVSGTTSVNEEGKIQGMTVYEQTSYVFGKIKGVVEKAGFAAEDIVLLRVYLVDMGKIVEFDRAFIEHFAKINPCCTLVGTSGLVDEKLLVEVECLVDTGE